MSTLAEIEKAVEMLTKDQQQVLFERLGDMEPSCYDLTRDLFEQPGQLGASGELDHSTNKEHLAGFGRPKHSSICKAN